MKLDPAIQASLGLEYGGDLFEIEALGKGIADGEIDPENLADLNGLGALFAKNNYEDLEQEELDVRIIHSQSSPDPGWSDMTRRMIEVSCAFTAQELLRGPPEPPYNSQFLIGEHHLEWDELISMYARICILAARDHGKSHFMTFAYGIWKIINNPRQSGFIFSATQDQAEEQLGKIREEIETNPKLQWLMPKTNGKNTTWGKRQIRCSNGHKVYARGFGTKVRGAHPCLAYDTEIVTENGIEIIGLLDGQRRRILTGNGTWKEAYFWKTGLRDVFTAQFGNKYTRDKQKLRLTQDHSILTKSGWKSARDVLTGEEMEIPPSRHDLNYEFMGWIWNDGSYHKTLKTQFVYFGKRDGEALERYRGFLTKNPHVEKCVYRVSRPAIKSIVINIGKGHHLRTVHKQPPLLTTAQQKTSWIRGMFSANGTVVRSVRIKLASLPLVEYIESILHEFGVKTTPIVSSTDKAGHHSHTIHVHKKSINHYLSVFGFVQEYKTKKARELSFPFYKFEDVGYGRRPRKTLKVTEDVYDFTVMEPSCEMERSAISNGVIVHNCWITIDDGLTDETQYSEIVRRKQKDYFKAAITNMIIPSGQIIVIGTPLASDDLYSELKDNPEYKFKKYAAETHPGYPDNRALWANRYSLDYLARRKREIGSIMYTREFICEPTSDEMSLFPSHLFRGTDVEMFNLTLGMPLEFWEDAGITTYIGVDFAMSSNVQADYTVIWVMGVDGYGNRWLIDIHREKGLPYQEQLSLINSFGRKYDPALILLEDNQMQRIFGDELIRTSDLPIRKYTTGTERNSLDKGVPGLRVLLENKKFRIPRGDKRSIELTDIWIEEMRSFTWLDGKLQSVAGHDDTVLACWMCNNAIKLGGFKFTFGEEYDDNDMDALMKELTGEDSDSEAKPDSELGPSEDGESKKEVEAQLV